MGQDLRRLTACLGLIAARGVPTARSRAVCHYTAALLAEIRAHHQGEDDIVWPVIAATAGPAVDLTPLTDDHQAIEAAAGRASQALASFTGEPGPFAVNLYASVSELRDMLNEHIADEEEQIFPVMRRYLAAEAYQWCEKQIQRKASLRGLRFTAPWLARYAQPDELSRLLATGDPRVRILLAAARPIYAQLDRQAFGASPAPPRRPAQSHPNHPDLASTCPPPACSGKRGNKMIKSYPDAAQRPGTLRPAPPAVVELAGVERLTAAGGSGSALIRVDLAIAAGETVAITGPSGSGSAVPE